MSKQRSDGIDGFSGSGDRDGYRNFAARARGEVEAGGISFGAAGFLIEGRSEFDGFANFVRADTLDTTDNRLAAARLWASFGSGQDASWSGTLSGSLLGSSNTNRLADDFRNRTKGRRQGVAALRRGALLAD